MILESGRDLTAFLRSVLHDCAGHGTVIACCLTMETAVAGVVQMPDPSGSGLLERAGFPDVAALPEFDGDLTPFHDTIVRAGADYPFVALGFHGDPQATAAGRIQPWQSSLDRLVLALAETDTALLAHVVFGEREGSSWSPLGLDPFREVPGLDFLPQQVFEHWSDESEVFLDRLAFDRIAAEERLAAAADLAASSRRGEPFGT